MGPRQAVLKVAIVATLALGLLAAPGPHAYAAENFASLYAAIQAANSGDGSQTITLSADIALGSALPVISDEITIDGNGYGISGDNAHRILDVASGRLTLKNLTLTGGKAPAGEYGGALRICISGRVTIEGVTFSDNSAENGGAIAADGAGIHLSITNSVFVRNHASDFGGAIFLEGGLVTVGRSSFTNNMSQEHGGAMAAKSGELQISNSTFHQNRAAVYSGVIHVNDADATLTHVTMTSRAAATALGGGIIRASGRVRLRNSIIWMRHADDDCKNGLDQSIGNLSKDGTCGVLPGEDPLLGDMTGSPAWRRCSAAVRR